MFDIEDIVGPAPTSPRERISRLQPSTQWLMRQQYAGGFRTSRLGGTLGTGATMAQLRELEESALWRPYRPAPDITKPAIGSNYRTPSSLGRFDLNLIDWPLTLDSAAGFFGGEETPGSDIERFLTGKQVEFLGPPESPYAAPGRLFDYGLAPFIYAYKRLSGQGSIEAPNKTFDFAYRFQQDPRYWSFIRSATQDDMQAMASKMVDQYVDPSQNSWMVATLTNQLMRDKQSLLALTSGDGNLDYAAIKYASGLGFNAQAIGTYQQMPGYDIPIVGMAVTGISNVSQTSLSVPQTISRIPVAGDALAQFLFPVTEEERQRWAELDPLVRRRIFAGLGFTRFADGFFVSMLAFQGTGIALSMAKGSAGVVGQNAYRLYNAGLDLVGKGLTYGLGVAVANWTAEQVIPGYSDTIGKEIDYARPVSESAIGPLVNMAGYFASGTLGAWGLTKATGRLTRPVGRGVFGAAELPFYRDRFGGARVMDELSGLGLDRDILRNAMQNHHANYLANWIERSKRSFWTGIDDLESLMQDRVSSLARETAIALKFINASKLSEGIFMGHAARRELKAAQRAGRVLESELAALHASEYGASFWTRIAGGATKDQLRPWVERQIEGLTGQRSKLADRSDEEWRQVGNFVYAYKYERAAAELAAALEGLDEGARLTVIRNSHIFDNELDAYLITLRSGTPEARALAEHLVRNTEEGERWYTESWHPGWKGPGTEQGAKRITEADPVALAAFLEEVRPTLITRRHFDPTHVGPVNQLQQKLQRDGLWTIGYKPRDDAGNFISYVQLRDGRIFKGPWIDYFLHDADMIEIGNRTMLGSLYDSAFRPFRTWRLTEWQNALLHRNFADYDFTPAQIDEFHAAIMVLARKHGISPQAFGGITKTVTEQTSLIPSATLYKEQVDKLAVDVFGKGPYRRRDGELVDIDFASIIQRSYRQSLKLNLTAGTTSKLKSMGGPAGGFLSYGTDVGYVLWRFGLSPIFKGGEWAESYLFNVMQGINPKADPLINSLFSFGGIGDDFSPLADDQLFEMGLQGLGRPARNRAERQAGAAHFFARAHPESFSERTGRAGAQGGAQDTTPPGPAPGQPPPGPRAPGPGPARPGPGEAPPPPRADQGPGAHVDPRDTYPGLPLTDPAFSGSVKAMRATIKRIWPDWRGQSKKVHVRWFRDDMELANYWTEGSISEYAILGADGTIYRIPQYNPLRGGRATVNLRPGQMLFERRRIAGKDAGIVVHGKRVEPYEQGTGKTVQQVAGELEAEFAERPWVVEKEPAAGPAALPRPSRPGVVYTEQPIAPVHLARARQFERTGDPEAGPHPEPGFSYVWVSPRRFADIQTFGIDESMTMDLDWRWFGARDPGWSGPGIILTTGGVQLVDENWMLLRVQEQAIPPTWANRDALERSTKDWWRTAAGAPKEWEGIITPINIEALGADLRWYQINESRQVPVEVTERALAPGARVAGPGITGRRVQAEPGAHVGTTYPADFSENALDNAAARGLLEQFGQDEESGWQVDADGYPHVALYHVTTARDKVLTSGLLSSAEVQLRQGGEAVESAGLGGTPSWISTTPSETVAQLIQERMHLAIRAARGEVNVSTILDHFYDAFTEAGLDAASEIADFIRDSGWLRVKPKGKKGWSNEDLIGVFEQQLFSRQQLYGMVKDLDSRLYSGSYGSVGVGFTASTEAMARADPAQIAILSLAVRTTAKTRGQVKAGPDAGAFELQFKSNDLWVVDEAGQWRDIPPERAIARVPPEPPGGAVPRGGAAENILPVRYRGRDYGFPEAEEPVADLGAMEPPADNRPDLAVQIGQTLDEKGLRVIPAMEPRLRQLLEQWDRLSDDQNMRNGGGAHGPAADMADVAGTAERVEQTFYRYEKAKGRPNFAERLFNPIPAKIGQVTQQEIAIMRRDFPAVLRASGSGLPDLLLQLGIREDRWADWLLADRRLYEEWVQNPSQQSLQRLLDHSPSDEVRGAFDSLYQSPEWEVITSLWLITMRGAHEEAFGTHFFGMHRSWFERTFNHPLLGIYPLSWSLKAARIWAKFLFDNHTFGELRLGMTPAVAIAEINRAQQVAFAQSEPEDLQTFLENGPLNSSLFIFNLIMPGDWSNIPFPASRTIRDIARGETDVSQLLRNNINYIGFSRDIRLIGEAIGEWYNLLSGAQDAEDIRTRIGTSEAGTMRVVRPSTITGTPSSRGLRPEDPLYRR